MLYIGNICADATVESLTEFVSRRAESLQIPDVEVFNAQVFKKENGPGASARITISEKAHAAINNRKFWPASAYVRLWKFQDKTSAVTEVTDSILVSGGTDRNSSTPAQLPSDKDGPVCYHFWL